MERSAFGVTGYAPDKGIGDIIRLKIRALNSNPGFKGADMMLIIKPTKDATYKNVVDAMDEVLINDVKHYAVTDVDKNELDFLNSFIQ